MGGNAPGRVRQSPGRVLRLHRADRGEGKYVAGENLQPTRTATTVRVRQGKISTTDGPFAETKEQLGGFYLIDAETLDDAIGTASRIPSARYGAIELRPVVDFSPADGSSEGLESRVEGL